MKWPQITLIVMYALSLGIHLSKHGEERTDKYNFWNSLASVTIIFVLLNAGGFF